eukprot:5947981-Prymnesium_polylepis.1
MPSLFTLIVDRRRCWLGVACGACLCRSNVCATALCLANLSPVRKSATKEDCACAAMLYALALAAYTRPAASRVSSAG